MTTQTVLVCSSFATGADGNSSCTSQTWVESYVVTPEQQASIDLFTTGGFDAEFFALFFTGTLMMFAVGFTTGIIISQLRKVRRI